MLELLFISLLIGGPLVYIWARRQEKKIDKLIEKEERREQNGGFISYDVLKEMV